MQRFTRLITDEIGAVLTTEVVLVSTLTVAAILSVAASVREGFRRQTDRLVRAINALEIPHIDDPQLVPVRVRTRPSDPMMELTPEQRARLLDELQLPH